MARNFVEKGLLVLACSVSVVTPAFAAAGPASNPTSSETAAAPAASTTSTTTTTTPSSTTTSASTVTTAPAATPAAPASPVIVAPAGAAAPKADPPATTAPPASAGASTNAAESVKSTTDAAKSETKSNAASSRAASWPKSWVVNNKETPTDNTNYQQTYPNAVHSESILIAEYLGYQKNPDVRFNQPLEADYKIVKILKGPPLNKRLPIKYEFHDRSNPPTPPGWKFNEKEMPAVGSKWLIFIEHSVPHNGQFETYEGNWGRQPVTEDNLNKVYELLQSQGEVGY